MLSFFPLCLLFCQLQTVLPLSGVIENSDPQVVDPLEMEIEKVDLEYSLKNIPIPSNREYLQQFINKTKVFLKNLRWKTFFHLNKDAKVSEKETYGNSSA